MADAKDHEQCKGRGGEHKEKGLLQKLFYPLHIKLPIEAVGIFLIAITALYVFKSMEPELKTRVAPSEETVSEYTEKEKPRKPSPKVKKQSQSPGKMSSNKDETATGAPSTQESGQPPAPPSEQSIYDKDRLSKKNIPKS